MASIRSALLKPDQKIDVRYMNARLLDEGRRPREMLSYQEGVSLVMLRDVICRVVHTCASKGNRRGDVHI